MRTFILLSAFASLVLNACGPGYTPVDFSFAEGCTQGCTKTGSSPVMLGSLEPISATSIWMPPTTVQSSDESVLSIASATRSCCMDDGKCVELPTTQPCSAEATPFLDITVGALAAGTAKVSLVDVDTGSVYASWPVTIAAPALLSLTCNEGSGTFTLHAGSSCNIGWTAADAAGNVLMATSGVALSTTDTSVFALVAANQPPAASVPANHDVLELTTLLATGAGEGMLTATAGGVSSSTVVFVDP